MAKIKELVTQRSVTALNSADLGDILIFPEFVKDFGYTRTQIKWEDNATPEDETREPNGDGQIFNEEGQIVGQVEWRSNGLLALSIIEGEPVVLFLNNRYFKPSIKIIEGNEDTIPHMHHIGSRLIKRGLPNPRSVYQVVKAYSAVGRTRNGEEYDFSQFGIDCVNNAVKYTDTEIIINGEEYPIDDIKTLYDNIFA